MAQLKSRFEVRTLVALIVTIAVWSSAFAGVRAGLNEVPALISIAGGVVALVGVTLVNWRPGGKVETADTPSGGRPDSGCVTAML